MNRRSFIVRSLLGLVAGGFWAGRIAPELTKAERLRQLKLDNPILTVDPHRPMTATDVIEGQKRMNREMSDLMAKAMIKTFDTPSIPWFKLDA